MIRLKLNLTDCRNGLNSSPFKLNPKNYIISKNYLISIVVLFMMASCNEAKPQSRQERAEAEKLRKKENLEQFYFGAIKMCINTDYQSYFGNYREMGPPSMEGNCCTALFPQPYIDPYEHYVEIYEEEKAIMLNHADPFELKRIREKMKGKKDNIRSKALKMDTDNLIYRTSALFVKYDINREELKLDLSNQFSFETGSFMGGISGVDATNLPSEYILSLKSDEAEKLFDYYRRNTKIGKLMPYSPLNIRMTYGLKFPERNTKYSKFEAVVKTIEVYPANNWTYKVGEITL